MAKSGIRHADVGDELSKAEWLDEENHELIHSNSFPATPAERQLFYRDDEHKWYIYNGTSWVSLQGGATAHLDDIGDVNVPTPSDDDLLYWDNAASQWKCKANWVAAHKTSHENGGSDEISLAGLSGAPADTINKSLLTAAGDIIKRGAAAPERLPIGSNDQVLTVVAGAPAWAAATGGGGTKIQDADSDTKVDTEESADEDKIRMDVAGTEAFVLQTTGVLDLPKQSRARAKRTTDQSIASGSFVKVQFTAEDFDEQNEFDSTTNYRFTAAQPGYYQAAGNAVFYQHEDGKRYIISIQKNGTIIAIGRGISGGAENCGATAACVIYLAQNDYLEMFVFHDCTTSKNIMGSSAGYVQLSVHKLS